MVRRCWRPESVRQQAVALGLKIKPVVFDPDTNRERGYVLAEDLAKLQILACKGARAVSSWVKEVKLEDVKDGASYFLARQSGGSTNITTWHFYARDIKGTTVMSTKPGIAVRFLGGEPFRETLRKHTDLTAIEVPADADRRWRRRVKRFW